MTLQNTEEDTSDHEKRIIATAEILRELHAVWKPHDAQKQILNAIFYEGKTDIYVEAGRKTGKTEVAAYTLIRYALLNPHSANYFFSPFLRQSKEILWSTQRVHKMIPPKYIAAINNTELRITLTNGSFIKLDGSDNTESYRGVTPHCIVADEFAQHDKNFWTAMQPNRAVHNGPLLIIGTPATQDGFATETRDAIKADKENGAYFNFSSFSNPHISHKWLNKEKERLIANGDEWIWELEYMARQVRNAKDSIFPMFSPERHVVPLADIQKSICTDYGKLQWVVAADPGTTSCFAVLFCALNPFNRKLYVLHEVYATDQRLTSCAQIIPQIESVVTSYPDYCRWSFVYDSAAQWFAGEAQQFQPIRPWAPVRKEVLKKDKLTLEPGGISIIRDAMRQDKLVVAAECENFIREISNYHRTWNRAGDVKILKKNDHLIDALRYSICELNYSLPEFAEPPPTPDFSRPKRMFSLEEDLKAERSWAE